MRNNLDGCLIRSTLLLACMLFFYSFTANANTLTVVNDDQETSLWQLSADRLVTYNDSNIIEGYGNVTLREGENYLKADFVRYFSDTKWIFLRDSVQVKMGRDVLKGAEAEFDLKNKVGQLSDGSIFMDGPHIYFTGEKIQKDFGDSYRFRNAKVTTCDGDAPAWSLSAREATIELEGYTQLWHSTVQVKNQDVMFLPYTVLPTKKKRQTGFLLPEVGQGSGRGLFYSQPFFWAISDTADLTYNAYWMEKRGVMQGLEFRSRATQKDNIWLRMDYLQDNRTDALESDEPGGLSNDGLVRDNMDRFWMRGMFDMVLPDSKWKLKGTVDYVSDQNYLREFSSGLSGFDRSEDELEDLFGRSIAREAKNRETDVLLSRDWRRVGLGVSASYTQNIGVGNGNLTSGADTTVQTLPQVDMHLFKGKLMEETPLPIEVQGTVQAANFTRNKGVSGSRFEVAPQISMPLTSRYGTIIPSIGVLHTQYSTRDKGDADIYGVRATGSSRTVPSMGVTAFTEFARNFELAEVSASNLSPGDSKWVGLRHSIQPRISYNNTPHVNQDSNPYYTVHDRLRPNNELTYSVTNLFSRKRMRVTGPAEKDGDPQQHYDYADFLRVNVKQGYDFREAERTDQRDKYPRRPFSDIEAEVRVNYDQYLALTTRTFWSPYLGDLTRHDHAVNLNYDWFSLRTRFNFREKIDEYKRTVNYGGNALRTMDSELMVNLWGPWSASMFYEVDLEGEEDIEKAISIRYTHQCFEWELRYMQDSIEDEFSFWVALPGLSF